MRRLNVRDAQTNPLDPATTTARPATPYNFNLLQSLQKGGASATDSACCNPSATPNADYQSRGIPAHNLADLLGPWLDDEKKRDSGIVSSGTGKEQESTANTRDPQKLVPPPTSWSVASLRRPSSSRFLRSVSSPNQRKLQKKRITTGDDHEDLSAISQGHIRSRRASFHGISLDIPRGSIEQFSEGGELRFSRIGMMTETMNGAATSDAEAVKNIPDGDTATSGATATQQAMQDGEVKGQTATQTATLHGEAKSQTAPIAGPKKATVHMLQAAVHNGRVLSSEEISLSVRLRSMYECGDENASSFNAPLPVSVRSEDSDQGDSMLRPDTPPSSEGAPSVRIVKQRPATAEVVRGRPAAARMSSILRTSSEVAGGLEDYSNVSGRDVDRYGFIQPSRCASRASNASTPTGDPMFKPSVQRVSSSLQLISDAPRQKRGLLRTPASNRQRVSRSVPRPSNNDARSLRTMRSQHSFRSTSGSFLESAGIRSKNQKLLDQASDMLTLPPGLEAIAEQEDAGRTATATKKREWKREEKWRKMAGPPVSASKTKGGGMSFHFNTHDPLVIKRTWKGIPDRWRATAWHSFLTSSAKQRSGESDATLIEEFHELQEENCADDAQIDVDVPRSINMHVMFRKRYRGGQRLLFRVLHAIALKFPNIGYVQGMASIATTLLCYYDEEMAFVMLVRLWELRGLRTFYTDGFEGLMAALAQFESDWLGKGEISAKLGQLGIGGTAYGTRWYLTLFNMSIPFPAQLRIWDVFMLHGDGNGEDFDGADLDVLHAASAALIDATRDILLDADFEVAMKTLTSWIPVKDEDLFMKVARAEFRNKKRRAVKGV